MVLLLISFFPYLSCSRKGFNKQQDLLTPFQNWIRSLDNKGLGGALFMDLSKASDTLNLDL